MTPTAADLAAVPDALRRRYEADPARWGAAIVSHAAQRAGLPAPAREPRPAPDRPPPSEVAALIARQRRCPHAQGTACRCSCDVLGRTVHVWTDCRSCPELPD